MISAGDVSNLPAGRNGGTKSALFLGQLIRRGDMTHPAILSTYRSIRESIEQIKDTAAAVDEHVGRCQIFGSQEELAHALAQAQLLGGKIVERELLLRRCARQGSNAPRKKGSVMGTLLQGAAP
jgi:hypothetical protein